MKILVTSDFYMDFAMYETEKPNELKNAFTLMLADNSITLDPGIGKIIGSSDSMTTEEAVNQAEEIIYISELWEALEIE